MGLAAAVSSGFRQYASFSGRARRSEYWWFTLALVLVYAVGLLLDVALGTTFLFVVALLAVLLPSISVTVRRLHDTNRSGAWYFISFVPLVGPIWLLVLMCGDSQPYANQYGPSPKYEPEAPALT